MRAVKHQRVLSKAVRAFILPIVPVAPVFDAFAGLYCVNVGDGRTEIADAIAKQAHELAYYHAYVGMARMHQ